MNATAVAPTIVETEQVRRWRLDALIRSGYPESDAQALSARSDVDLHQAVELLRSGCSVELALAILL